MSMHQAGMDTPVVSMWVDDPAVGCGERQFIVLSTGPKWATLMSPASLDKIEVSRQDFDKYAKPSTGNPKVAAAILKRNAKAAKRLHLRYGPKQVDRAKAVLTGGAQ